MKANVDKLNEVLPINWGKAGQSGMIDGFLTVDHGDRWLIVGATCTPYGFSGIKWVSTIIVQAKDVQVEAKGFGDEAHLAVAAAKEQIVKYISPMVAVAGLNCAVWPAKDGGGAHAR